MTARATFAVCIAAVLGACTSAGDGPAERVGRLAHDQLLPGSEDVQPIPELDRAALDQIPFATIALSIDDSQRAFVVPLADNGGYLTYMDESRRGIVMQGGAVVGTLGLGIDLNGILNAANDPIANPTPLAEWPGQVNRSYQYRVRDGAAYAISVTCIFERVVRERIEIIGLSYDVVRIAETCTSPARQIVNEYWVAPETGFIWKSFQWVSPKQSPIRVEIIRPFGRG